jgi:hypothetical protein
MQVYFEATAKGVVPNSNTKQGTISSNGKIITGTGTSFKSVSQVRVGDYIYSALRNQVRRVTAIFSDTRLDIDKPFSTDISAQPLEVIKKHRSEKSFSNTGTTTAKLSALDFDNQNFVAGQNVTLNTSSPICYDPNGGKLAISNQSV